MLTLYTQTTPNGRKPLILLEEAGIECDVRFVDLSAGEQKSEAFLSLNPNGKIPVLVDDAGAGGTRHVVTESGAILVYLAELVDSPLWPSEPRSRSITLQWLMFQMATVGPMMGQAGYFLHRVPEPQPLATSRFVDEVNRILSVLDTRLTASRYLAGDYSLADIATYPWVAFAKPYLGLDISSLAGLQRWLGEVAARPAVARAMAIKP